MKSLNKWKYSGFFLVLASAPLLANTLQESINEALATNPEILIRTTEASARNDEVRQAKSGYLPSIDLRAGIGYENSRNSTTLGAFRAGNTDDKDQSRTRRDASIVARQMIFDGFSVHSEVKRQRARRASAEQDVCFAAESIALDTTRTYIDILRQQAIVELTKANAKEHDRIVRLIRKQGRSGRSNEADIAQAEGRLVLAKANEISAQATLQDLKTRYLRLAGKLPSRFEEPAIPDMLPESQLQALDLAMENHPALRLAAADIKAAEAQYQASKSSFMPRVELEVGANWDTDANGGKGDSYTHTAKLNMTYNLFRGGADSARKRQTSKLVNEALEVRNRVIRQVSEDVRLSWVAVEYGRKRLLPLTEHVQQADLSLRLYNKQFMIGSRTLLDLLDSQNEYFSARKTEISARYNLLFDQYRLLQASGLLLKSLNAVLPVANHCGLVALES